MPRVITGLDRWLAEGPACAGLPADARVALLAHPASIDGNARHVLEVDPAPGTPGWVRLFAPEHGMWGREQDMEPVGGAVEPGGLSVLSLYGDDPSSLRPAAGDLEDLDAIVVDLQDVGSRYYTFVYTMAYVMEAAVPAGLPVVVLDRPNPIGGERVEGPVLQPGLESFVGRFPLPVRHGMTIGELAGLFRGEFAIDADLRVVAMEHWERSAEFDRTGLPWVPPSPNMPALSTARVYPGGCLIEGTNLSEGRGTTLPFELVGAPWLDGAALAAVLRGHDLPGVLFRAATFRPMFQKHAGESCGGVHVIVTRPEIFRPFETYLAVVAAARAQRPEEFAWRIESYEFETDRLAIDLLLGRSDLRPMLEAGAALDELCATWTDELSGFVERRRNYLLYSCV